MAKINGTLIILDVDGDELAHVSNASLTINRELPEANDKDSAPWADHLDDAGLMDWEVSIDGNADWVSATGNVKILADILVARTAVAVIFGPSAAGSVQYSGNASTGSLTFDAPTEETATLSGTMTGKGILNIITAS